jgi:DsbC/DsbD-like thiol-disulfide interchange protein
MKKLALPLALLALSIGAYAAWDDIAPKMALRQERPGTTLAPGGDFKAIVTVSFAPGLHAYQNPPSEDYMIPLTVEAVGKDFILRKVEYPKGVDAAVGGDTKAVRVYNGTISVPVTLTAPRKAGEHTLRLKVGYQQCTDTTCYPPADETVSLKVRVGRTGK